MGIKEDMIKVERNLVDAEARLQQCKAKINTGSRELVSLEIVKSGLEENLVELKRDMIVTSAFEYQKVKGDLLKTTFKMGQIDHDLKILQKNYAEIEKSVTKIDAEFKKLQQEVGKNVVVGEFGKKGRKTDG